MTKARKFGEPKYLVDLLNPLTTQSDMVLRSGYDPLRLHEPRAVRECSFAAWSFSAPRLCNQLPLSMKGLTSVKSFKRKIKMFL